MLVIGWFGAVWEGRGGTREGSPEHFLPLCPGRLGTKCRNRQSLMLSPSLFVPLPLVQRWAFALLPPKVPAGTLPPSFIPRVSGLFPLPSPNTHYPRDAISHFRETEAVYNVPLITR